MEGFEKYVGVVFDNRYKIEKIIGIGGMAVVYKANDLLMRREVAVKMLRDEIAEDEASVKRFINESKAVAMLSHPNIVNIFDVSVRDNVKYIVMEYVEGVTLKNYMTRRGILSVKEIISYTSQILSALEHAHTKGIIHRDIKPQNIMLLKSGQIKVMDFGIAKLPNAETVTVTDKAIGTVYYISPEQASGHIIDARSDLYSLGVLMYEMAVGQLPFTGDSPVTVALMHLNDDPIPPRKLNAELPIGLEQIILKAMEKDPSDRYQGAALMLRQLDRIRENPAIVFREPRKTKKKQKKQPAKNSNSMLPIILGVMFAFLITLGVSGFVLLDQLFFSSSADQSETISVTDFVGAYYTEDLKSWFQKSEYYSVTVSYEFDPTHDKGVIIRQFPGEGERRKVIPGKQKCNVSLVISKGAETVVLPDYILEDYRSAESACKNLGLAVRVESIPSETFAIGRVIRTEPEAGSTLKLGETVTIYRSIGPAAGTVLVPNFIGLSEVQALQKLSDTGLRVGEVTYKASTQPAGTILSQSIAELKDVHANTTIDFEVSGGASYRPPSDSGSSVIPSFPDTTFTPFPNDPQQDFLDWLNQFFGRN